MIASRRRYRLGDTSIRVPVVSLADKALIREAAQNRHGLRAELVAEQAGRDLPALLDATVGRLSPGMRITLLVGGGLAGGVTAVAARYFANRGARVTVLFDRAPKDLPPTTGLMASMLMTLNTEWQRVGADDEALIDLYLSPDSPLDLVVDGLFDERAPGSPSPGARALVAAATACGRPVLAVEAPAGLYTPLGPALRAEATLAVGLPLDVLATEAGAAASGQVYLSDVSWSAELFSEVGVPLGPMFAAGSPQRLSLLQG